MSVRSKASVWLSLHRGFVRPNKRAGFLPMIYLIYKLHNHRYLYGIYGPTLATNQYPKGNQEHRMLNK